MKLRYRVGTRVIYLVWKILFGFRVEGRENIPDNGGIIIASNHLSSYDPPLIGTAVWSRECYFFAKRELFIINKFYSCLIRAFNAYPVDTRKPDIKALKQTKSLLGRGLGIIFFPEGTRSKTGQFLDFNPGVGWLAIKCNVPIVPTLIKGTNTPLISQLFRKHRVYVKFGVPILGSGYWILDTGKGMSDSYSMRTRAELITRAVEKSIRELAGDSTQDESN